MYVISDQSYYDVYYRYKDFKEYSYKICPSCNEEVALGFRRMDSCGGYATSSTHRCKNTIDAMMLTNGFPQQELRDRGFILKELPTPDRWAKRSLDPSWSYGTTFWYAIAEKKKRIKDLAYSRPPGYGDHLFIDSLYLIGVPWWRRWAVRLYIHISGRYRGGN